MASMIHRLRLLPCDVVPCAVTRRVELHRGETSPSLATKAPRILGVNLLLPLIRALIHEVLGLMSSHLV